MSIINVLDSQTANLIAAGEVVDRPAAVVKELVENAIDAGSTAVTVEIKNGGSSLIRVTDNGKGMDMDDIKLCVLRHATSKIKEPRDLEGIKTLGFRGEALAAISSVSRFQIISKTKASDFGNCMSMEGENILSVEEVGCPDGTTVTVRDIFFNVPARRKFLKKDTTETAYIAQYAERLAISHPDVSFKFIADSKTRFQTDGKGDIKSAVYAIYGREFADSLVPIDKNYDNMKISGYITHPNESKNTRNFQLSYINGRFVKAKTVVFAIEDAYRDYIMTERYPAYVIFISLNPNLVDVNVHPSKLEVRFVDDMSVRQNVYFAVRNAIENIDNPINTDYKKEFEKRSEETKTVNAFVPVSNTKPEQIKFAPTVKTEDKKEIILDRISKTTNVSFEFESAKPIKNEVLDFSDSKKTDDIIGSKPLVVEINAGQDVNDRTADFYESKPIEQTENKFVDIKYCGCVFDTYIICEFEDSMYLIDKHAAHERIIYESLKRNKELHGSQQLLDTIPVFLSSVEYETAFENKDSLFEIGFDFDSLGMKNIGIRGVPSEFSGLDTSKISDIFQNFVKDIINGKSLKLSREEIFDRSLYNAACKAAVKGGWKDDEASYRWMIEKLFADENIFCCPHGRPIMTKFTKYQIEKLFKRT